MPCTYRPYTLAYQMSVEQDINLAWPKHRYTCIMVQLLYLHIIGQCEYLCLKRVEHELGHVLRGVSQRSNQVRTTHRTNKQSVSSKCLERYYEVT